MMNKIKSMVAAIAALSFTLGAASGVQAENLGNSLGVYAFPQAQQSPEQISNDDAQCYSWAVEQTGYNPHATEVEPQQQQTERHRLRGAARGAVGGAVIGEVVDDDAGKGAAVGATLGTMRGGAQARESQAQAEQQAAMAKEAELEGLRGAYKSCMSAKEYSV